jgi:hypothetical protein
MARENHIIIESDYRREMARNTSKLRVAGDTYTRTLKNVNISTKSIEAQLSTTIISFEFGVLTMVSGITQLIDVSDDVIKAIVIATAGIGVASSLIAIYSAWTTAKTMMATAMWTEAAWETAASIVTLRWHAIAAAVLALATFSVAFYAGRALGAPEATEAAPVVVDGGMINLSDPASRRRITSVVAGV